MREVKFRAWDGRNMHEVYQLIFRKSGSISVRDMQFQEIESPVLMQYTDLEDKNGVSICEGDILYHTREEMTGSVILRNGGFRTDAAGWGEDWLGVIDTECEVEVVGNIHQNPELLGVAA